MHSKVKSMNPLVAEASIIRALRLVAYMISRLSIYIPLKAPWSFILFGDSGLHLFRSTCVVAQSYCNPRLYVLLALVLGRGKCTARGKSVELCYLVTFEDVTGSIYPIISLTQDFPLQDPQRISSRSCRFYTALNIVPLIKSLYPAVVYLESVIIDAMAQS